MRRRLVLVVGAITAGSLLLVAAPLAVVLKRNYQDEEVLRLQRDTVAETRSIDLTGRSRDPIELPRTSDRVTVFDRDGKLVDGYPERSQPVLVHAAQASGKIEQGDGGGRLLVAVPLLTGERVSGVVLAQRDDAVVDRRSRNAWLAIGALAIAILALGVGAATLIARRLARPLEALGSLAGRLGDGDFSVRTERTGVPETDAVAVALDTTAARLGEMVARERRFSSDASHQLRTPLAALRLELESAALAGGDTAGGERALAEVERLERTITTLLAAARDTDREPGVADLDQAIREVESRWHGPLAAAGRPLRTLRSSGVRHAPIAQSVLSEILQVLLENALVHGDGAVSVTIREAADALAIDVADEGPGFEPELDHGGPAATGGESHGSGAGDRHGIGLALARSLAHAEGAELRVVTAPSGALVTLFLRLPADSEGA